MRTVDSELPRQLGSLSVLVDILTVLRFREKEGYQEE